MKTKFESNVATQIPKTKMAYEPQLPWEISNYNSQQSGSLEDTAQSVVIGKVPLGVRPIFLVMLLVVLFVGTICMFVRTTEENEKVRMDILKKEKIALLLQAGLKKAVKEKDVLKKKAVRLEKDLADLGIRNKTFITVIENLSRRVEEAAIDQPRAKKKRR